ncbi:IS21 family transposase [Baia soyae]|uniref:Integrase-like protein n=1 Tax=Baia soyae TaxID=1544746 RepID=A0A4R2RNP2_9BACL|nr:IS21 family transposase [Baia soyae]TCP63927.1 integrase-like protein [Baia soyae]
MLWGIIRTLFWNGFVNESAPPKQRHTAKRIYDRLVEEYGFAGGESTVRAYVRKLRNTKPDAFVPLEFSPGEFAQFDWGEAYVLLQGKQIKVQIFCMRCTFSRRIFVKVFHHQQQEAPLQGHVDAFEFFEAVPRTVTYDNLKTAVKKVLEGKNREEQDRFIQLRMHYLFNSHFCDLAKGNQKGQVENLVKIVRKQYLTPVPSVSSLEELNQMLLDKCIAYEKTLVPRTSRTVGDAYKEDKASMLPLPTRPLACCRERYVKSNSLSMVAFEKNFYSVPVRYASSELTGKIFAEHVEFYYKDELIATHRRCVERNQEILNYDHYLDLLLQRPGAVLYARPLKQADLPPIYTQFQDKLRLHSQGMKEFVRILLLHREFEPALVEKALKEAWDKGMIQYDAIRQLLFSQSVSDHRQPPITFGTESTVPKIQVKTPDLKQYNKLYQKWSVLH